MTLPVKDEFAQLSIAKLLGKPVTVLKDVDEAHASALLTVGIKTVLDLADARVFATAATIADPGLAAAQGGIAADRIDDRLTDRPIPELATASISVLDGIGPNNRHNLEELLNVKTVSDLAVYPPFLAAKGMLANFRMQNKRKASPAQVAARLGANSSQRADKASNAARKFANKLSLRERQSLRAFGFAPGVSKAARGKLDFGFSDDDRWWRAVPKPLKTNAETTTWPLALLDGRKVNMIRIRDTNGHKSFWYRGETGATRSLDEIDIALMPLYQPAEFPADGPVIVTEGASAADAVAARGLACAGTLTGALEAPSQDALLPILGRDIILWPDNDDAGLKHMMTIARMLDRLGARSVRLIRWAEGGVSADAADFDGDADAMKELVDSATPVSPSEMNRLSRPLQLRPTSAPLNLRLDDPS